MIAIYLNLQMIGKLLFKSNNQMANVRGFADIQPGNSNPVIRRNHPRYNNNNEEGGGWSQFQEPVQIDQLRLAEEHKVLFVSGRIKVKNPMDENYWDMLKFALCPVIKLNSITFLIFIADIVMFIIQCSNGLDKSSLHLLGIKSQTLIDYGANYQPLVLAGQVYRLVSAMFLHVYFLHLFGNVITTLMFLSRVQYTYGPLKTLLIYLLSGIFGNIFSILISPQNVKAGASTALYGIIGLIIGYIIINWNGFDLIGPTLKCQVACTGLMIIVFVFIFTPSDNGNVDYYGHLGGFLAGFWLSAIRESIVTSQRQKIIRGVFFVLLFAQFLMCFLIFYLK